jgi:hypothetical protein
LKLNRAWHEQNRMPKNATLDQRVRWHMEHQANCSCRPAPSSVQRDIDKRREVR